MATKLTRHVVVTGAAGGIGRQLVQELVDHSYCVTAMDLAPEALDRLNAAHGQQILTLSVDVTNSGEVDAAVSKGAAAFGAPFGLVNLAGNNILKPAEGITDDEWRFLIDVNLTSAFYMSRAVIPLMKNAGGGRIINMSSIFGIRGNSNDAAYSAAKAGVVGLTRALAAELALESVTVNCIAPPVILTERVARMPKEHLNAQLERIPMRRLGEISDVTSTARWLLGADTAFYTGQTFSPNGGDVMP